MFVFHASTFLHSFAPRELPRFSATTNALTSVQCVLRISAYSIGVSPPAFQYLLCRLVSSTLSLIVNLNSCTDLPVSHSATFLAFCHQPPDVFHHRFSCSYSVVDNVQPLFHLGLREGNSQFVTARFRLRHRLAGSPRRQAETCFLSYGLQVRFQLLSTPPHDDAVIFSYRERASPGRGLTPHWSRLLTGALVSGFSLSFFAQDKSCDYSFF